MYSFPVAAVTNYHKLSGLKQQKFILSELWSPEIKNQYHWAEIKVSAGPRSLGKLQGRSRFLPLLVSGGCCHGLACGHITLVSAVVLPSPLLCVSNLLLHFSHKYTDDCI